ncbi:hypothetical protein CC78DRAFT_575857 [Lojkania enalia]|uniref:Secreted protein n=1 Tax=Lojkania enalia TaxID=147567 RepID=A0A9P4N8E4_9PLEO|nr:hypothetical protein CC78DRAFT_575857 [Didymosphaeria enalia]
MELWRGASVTWWMWRFVVAEWQECAWVNNNRQNCRSDAATPHARGRDDNGDDEAVGRGIEEQQRGRTMRTLIALGSTIARGWAVDGMGWVGMGWETRARWTILFSAGGPALQLLQLDGFVWTRTDPPTPPMTRQPMPGRPACASPLNLLSDSQRRLVESVQSYRRPSDAARVWLRYHKKQAARTATACFCAPSNCVAACL